jgi:hypothetical protein
VTALSETINLPLRIPAAVGVNVTLTEQDAPAASVCGGRGQVFAWLKSPVAWTEVIDSGTVCWFFTWIALPALVVPSFCELNVKRLGDSATGDRLFTTLGLLTSTLSKERLVGEIVSRFRKFGQRDEWKGCSRASH